MLTFGSIGCGNMGGAILQGILQGGTPAADIYVADHNLETLRQKLGHTGVQICRSNTEVAALCDTVFLAVKPNVLAAVLAEIGPVLAERTALPLLISIAAGKSTAYLEEQLTVPCPVVRVMPNINALVGEAVSAVCAGKNATADQAKTVCDLMACTGKVLELDEAMFPLFGAGSFIVLHVCVLSALRHSYSGLSCFLMIRSRTLFDRSKGFVLFSEEYKKSEPFSYRKKVRILLLWCTSRDSNPGPTD